HRMAQTVQIPRCKESIPVNMIIGYQRSYSFSHQSVRIVVIRISSTNCLGRKTFLAPISAEVALSAPRCGRSEILPSPPSPSCYPLRLIAVDFIEASFKKKPYYISSCC
uniref:Uncharacterized protein n=1 Tax=Parascaris univalens TaxID=6257 RepID=A0A915B9E3_PARUN